MKRVCLETINLIFLREGNKYKVIKLPLPRAIGSISWAPLLPELIMNKVVLIHWYHLKWRNHKDYLSVQIFCGLSAEFLHPTSQAMRIIFCIRQCRSENFYCFF